MMALGIYVVYVALTHPPREGHAELSLGWAKLSLKGPAWLIMIAIGAMMAAAPVIAAVAQHNAQAPFEPSKAANAVEKIEEPDYRNFQFLTDVSYLDLSNSLTKPWYASLPGWQRFAGRHRHIRPASLINYMTIRKVGSANKIHIVYSTSGLLDLRCLTHAFSVETAVDKEDQFVGDIIADVSSIQTGTEFTLITQVTYWNAFSGADGDDFSTYTHNQRGEPESISTVLVFPDAKPFKSVTRLEKAPTEEEFHRFQGLGQSIEGPNNHSYYWSTTNNNPGRWFYTFRWTW
jgi:hypothetical protein